VGVIFDTVVISVALPQPVIFLIIKGTTILNIDNEEVVTKLKM